MRLYIGLRHQAEAGWQSRTMVSYSILEVDGPGTAIMLRHHALHLTLDPSITSCCQIAQI